MWFALEVESFLTYNYPKIGWINEKSENPYLSHLFIIYTKKLFMRKNFFITIIAILTVNIVSAQLTRLGFTVGPTYSTMFEKVGGEKHMHDYRTAITFGTLLDVPMQSHGSFQPGLNYVMKNSEDNFVDINNKNVLQKVSITYVEVPINVVFRIPAKSNNFLLGAGVAAAMAVKGKITEEVDHTLTRDEGLNFGDDTKDDYGKYDFGINAIVGYEFHNGWFIQANYNHGINRLFVGGNPDDKLYNRYFALRFGYLIPRKKK